MQTAFEAMPGPVGPESPASATGGGRSVVLVDDHPPSRGLISGALSRAGLNVVGEAATAGDGVRTVEDLQPAVVLTEIVLEGRPALAAISRMLRAAPGTHIVVLSRRTEPDCVLEALLAGASGYMLKGSDPGVIVEGILTAVGGEPVISPTLRGGLLASVREREALQTGRGGAARAVRARLTERELDVLARLPLGESNREIARALSVSENTVRKHVANILAKLDLDNRVQAAVEAVRSGLSAFGGVVLLGAISTEAGLGLVSSLPFAG
jgi:DNA-binding NarL/FixJ family response regulator